MARADFRFSWSQRTRYSEVDAQAVVFNSRYLEYFDLVTTEYFRTLGFYGPTGLLDPASKPMEFHLASASVQYKAPLLLDEVMTLCCRVSRIGTSSLTMDFEIHGPANGPDGEDLRATGEIVHVHVAQARGRPTPIPDWIIEMFERYEGRELKQRL